MEATFEVPVLGSYWQGQGGIRAVPDLKDSEGRVYDLVLVTDADHKPVILPDQEWGEFGEEVEGADSVRDGAANTAALVKAGNALAETISKIVTPDGQTDCHWPSQVELMGCYIYVKDLLGTDDYWSSSQFHSYLAWSQHFSYGDVYGWTKDNDAKAFPVRRVYR